VKVTQAHGKNEFLTAIKIATIWYLACWSLRFNLGTKTNKSIKVQLPGDDAGDLTPLTWMGSTSGFTWSLCVTVKNSRGQVLLQQAKLDFCLFPLSEEAWEGLFLSKTQ
jgi:hypothetical protein